MNLSWAVLLLLGVGAPRALYVDLREEGRAVLIEEHTGRVVRVGEELLPQGAGEGSWLGEPDALELRAIRQRRARLSRDDDFQDLQLQR